MTSVYRVTLVTLTALCAIATARGATLPTAAALGLGAGEQYAFVFVSSGTINGTSSSQATYNNFVSTAATNAGINVYNGNALAWHSVTSTASTTMNVNAPVASTVKVFLINGTMVANGGTVSFYATCNPSGAACDTHLAAINITENGTTVAGTNAVWTGGFDGRGSVSGSGVLGTANANGPTAGNANGTKGLNGDPLSWIRTGNSASSNLNHVYALSDTLTAVAATPEPASVALIGSALAGLLVLRRRRT